MELGTKEFNDSAMEMFGGKPKQQTAVEWLVKELQEADCIPKDSLIMKYVIKQAIEMEKQQQGYTEEDVLNIIDNYNETFKVDLILREDFNQWFNKFKNR